MGREDGFTLIELIVAMAILLVVLLGITSLYISGIRGQTSLTMSFQAQTELHVGMDHMRKDVHLACSQTAQSASSVTLSEPPCDGSVLVTWCTQGSGTSYGLYRVSGSSCSGGVKYASFLTSGSVFSYLGSNTTPTTPATGSNALARLHVSLTADADPRDTGGAYTIVDDIVFRNGVRT